MKKNKKYNTQEVCEIFDISKATLFRWESEGQITNVMRDWRNWRIYSDENLAEIKNIIKSKGKR
ncbi:MAG: MerR family transcriptional regulator [Nitrospirae bacterium]|nr:MerR family transcriptional regulator [Nitrospirota bacterium]